MENVGSIFAIGSAVVALSTVFHLYFSVSKFKEEIQKDVESKFVGKLEIIKSEFASFKEHMSKDLENTKSIFNNEIKHLGDKLDSLRDEVRRQHEQQMQQQGQLIDLLKTSIED